MSEDEAPSLRAEVIALQSLLVGLLGALNRTEGGKALARQAFDYADTVVEVGLFQGLGEGAPDYLPMVAKVLEQLRAGCLD